MIVTKHKSKMEQAEILNKLIQSLKKQGDPDNVRRLKKALTHLKTFLNGQSESKNQTGQAPTDLAYGKGSGPGRIKFPISFYICSLLL
jgi:hypothetical protein